MNQNSLGFRASSSRFFILRNSSFVHGDNAGCPASMHGPTLPPPFAGGVGWSTRCNVILRHRA
ncbi:MAG TPA: hypothetical protein VKQ28_00670, partial [Candidatus Acidoferrum sp.]|nr:hypothetical protein [Candidatus Acidoferrum sp.]